MRCTAIKDFEVKWVGQGSEWEPSGKYFGKATERVCSKESAHARKIARDLEELTVELSV